MRQKFTELGKSVGLRVGRNVVKSVLEKLDLEALRSEARTASSAAAEMALPSLAFWLPRQMPAISIPNA